MTRINADNLFGLSDFIVDPNAAKGSFTSIQAAITAASSGDVVFIKNGTYVEDLTLKLGVDLIGVDGDGRDSTGVNVIGVHMLNGNGFVVAQNISFSAPMGNIFTITGGPGQNPVLALKNCAVDSPIGMVAQLIGGGGHPTLILVDSDANANGIGITCSDGSVSMQRGGLTSNTAEGVVLSGTSDVKLQAGASISAATTGIVLNSAPCTAFIEDSEVVGNGGPCVQFNAAANVDSINNFYSCANGAGFYIQGAGTYRYAGDVISGSASAIDPLVTQFPYPWRPFATAGNAGTAVRGTAGFDSTEFTVTDGLVNLAGGPTGIVWSDVAAPAVVSSNTGSFTTNAITLTLPAAATEGQECRFFNTDGSVMVVMANAAQFIRIGNTISLMGGTTTSTTIGDGLWLTFRSADNTWYAIAPEGNWSIP